MSATATVLRIGEVASQVGTTPRTIRYYEEIGLLPAAEKREAGRHRLYGERDVQRLRDALRLKELLGLSLDELKELLEAEEARAALRDEWEHGEPGTSRRHEMLHESRRLLDRQLELVRRRRDEIAALERELEERRRRVTRRLRELGDD